MILRLSEVRVKKGRGQQLVEWLRAYKFFNPTKVYVVTNEPDVFRIQLYTQGHCYFFVVKDDYLGCMASTRKPRPGEGWTRGNDLPDGKFSLATLREIMGAIVFYEAVAVVKTKK